MGRRRGEKRGEGSERMKWAETEGRRVRVDGTRRQGAGYVEGDKPGVWGNPARSL